MRRGLVWLLGGVLALTAVTLWVPQRALTIVQAIDSRRVAAEGRSEALNATAVQSPLPAVLERIAVEPARRDPFADAPIVVTAAASPVKPTLVAAQPMPVPAPPASPPSMQWRLMGTMAAPNGQRLVMLTNNSEQQTVVAEPGAQLAGGYEISAVTPDAVHLLYPPLQTQVVIPIPPQQAPDR